MSANFAFFMFPSQSLMRWVVRGFFMADTSIAIIGAGIVGFQIAYELYKKGIHDFAIFEANEFAGEHSSSRNSGVLHAGIYYPEGTFKHEMCLQGNELWSQVSDELSISLQRPGKYVISTDKNEDLILENIFEQTLKKKVPGIRRMSKSEIREISPFVNISNGFFSETTGILNVSEAIKRLEEFFYQKNIPLLKGQKVEHIERSGKEFVLKVAGEKVRSEFLVNCGGLYGVTLRRKLGLQDLEDYWVKGRYLKLKKTKKDFYCEKLIYPIPNKNLKGLGVHTSFDFDKVVRFGPDTLDVHDLNYHVGKEAIEEMYPAISKVFKGFKKSDLEEDYAGVRSKIIKVPNREQHTDFWIESPLSNYIECLGIESPGLTASPSIARFVVSRILGREGT